MKKSLIFGSIIALVLLATLFFLSLSNSQKEEFVEEPIEFPEFENNEEIDQEVVIGTTLRDGRTVSINNIKQGAEYLGSDTYVFAGGEGDNENRYDLTYFEEYDYFQVSLEATPLSEVRELAQERLLDKLGVDPFVLCQLNISVRTRLEISQEYAGNELGISFCPGSIELP